MHQPPNSTSSSSLIPSMLIVGRNLNDCDSASVSCSTKVEPVRLSLSWTIENFAPLLKLCKPGHCLRSHVFRHPKQSESTWQLNLYPAGKRPENAGFVSLFLKMSSTSPNKEILVTAEYKFFFLDDAKQVKFTNVNVGDFHAKPPKCGHSWGLRNIPRNRVLSSLNKDGSLLVHCEIEFLPDPCRLRSYVCRPTAACSIFGDEKSYFVDKTKNGPLMAKSFIDNNTKAFAEELFCDCTIFVSINDKNQIKDEEMITENLGENLNSAPQSTDAVQFKVHKFMLAAHSPVFRAMFDSENRMLESRKNQIFISDFKPHVVKAMLEFLYSCGTKSPPSDDDDGGKRGSGDDVDEKSPDVFRPYWKLTAAATAAADDDESGEEAENADGAEEDEESSDDSSAAASENLTCRSKWDNNQALLIDLLALAEKYSINHLKLQCQHSLSEKITNRNVCSLIASADLHRADQLKRCCVDFLANRRQDLLTKSSIDHWPELKKSNPQLANEILESLLVPPTNTFFSTTTTTNQKGNAHVGGAFVGGPPTLKRTRTLNDHHQQQPSTSNNRRFPGRRGQH